MNRFISTVKSAIPAAVKTAIWMIKLTIIVTLAVTVMKYFGLIDMLSAYLDPVFKFMGLPGEASLVFISGYFVNIYSAIAVLSTLEIDLRAVTIIAVMCLCAHNMIIETAVQKKTGSSFWLMIFVRTFYALASGLILNLILPQNTTMMVATNIEHANYSFEQLLLSWFKSTSYLSLKMFIVIITLNIMQKLLTEYGVMAKISSHLGILMKFFGLPANASFLWIVANILGLAYGSAVMVEEVAEGRISKKDADLLNFHIGISHSNLEDMLLFFFMGASLPWMLLFRWFLSFTAVWIRKFQLYLKESLLTKQVLKHT